MQWRSNGCSCTRMDVSVNITFRPRFTMLVRMANFSSPPCWYVVQQQFSYEIISVQQWIWAEFWNGKFFHLVLFVEYGVFCFHLNGMRISKCDVEHGIFSFNNLIRNSILRIFSKLITIGNIEFYFNFKLKHQSGAKSNCKCLNQTVA
jgi:hypothetical protein